ncbi:hypothetical protein SAZ10_00745 [Mesorhizobium sp. BAC0120]|uniref:hypothetical protein n=1 Tax=Mesorhizobium sp. BAC0120 TaxID=3090670 RepID=UPI00298CFC03|nr:hypothetical protein [Mesorhizobium sp. BAC0120]MDW6020284.1 hypothetical protein [Mesorhizobium sp. BAC0120]
MPRCTDRNFLLLAQAQNRALWRDIRRYDYPAGYIASLESNADRQQARYLHLRRARLVERINEAIALPASFFRSVYFRSLSGQCVVAADEAVEEIRRALRRERGRVRSRHWSARPERLAELAEAMTYARYFRRYAKRVWLSEAA